MVDFKELLKETKATVTSPTAFAWYGVAGVIATGVLTFFATKNHINNFNKRNLKKDSPFKDKAKEVGKTVVRFAPPVLTAIGSSYCIIHGNNKSIDISNMLLASNDRLAARLDKYKAFAAGAATSELKKHVEPEDDVLNGPPHRLYFSDDDLRHEDYGKNVQFCIEGRDIEFISTPLEVLLAEYEFNKLVWGLRVGEFGSLNELLDMFGARKEPDGDYCGWSKEAGFDNGYSWIGFKHVKVDYDDGTRGYMICFESEPTYDELFERLIHG